MANSKNNKEIKKKTAIKKANDNSKTSKKIVEKEVVAAPISKETIKTNSNDDNKISSEPKSIGQMELKDIVPVKLQWHKYGKLTLLLTGIFNIACYVLIGVFSTLAATNDEFREMLKRLTGLDSDTIEFFVQIGGFAVAAFIIYCIVEIWRLNRSYVGKSSIKDVRLSDSKYKDLFNGYIKYCKVYGLNYIPICYLSDSKPDSQLFGVNIYSQDGISIPTKPFKDASITNDYSECEYFLCRRLSHIALGYNDLVYQLLTLWTNLIPPFKKAIDRVKCYTVDKAVAAVIGKEKTIKGIFNENYRTDLYGDDSMETIISKKYHCNKMEAFGRIVETLEQERPFAYNRIDAIINDKDGRIF